MPAGCFIVSTGRCGSTLLSDLLREHPALLSLSELFSSLRSTRMPAFPPGDLAGADAWRLLTTPRPEVNLLLMQRCADTGAHVARGLSPGRVPPLLMGPLPGLSPDPLALHEELGAFVRGLPAAPAAKQYTRAFEWLCGRLDRGDWVERSAGSAAYADELVRGWPEARYVHLVRDGRATARSMSANDGFRMAVLLEELGDRAATPAGLVGAIASLRTAWIPIERFGELWSRQVIAADRWLRALPDERRLTLRYEDLVGDAAGELRRLASFLGLGGAATGRWVRAAAARVARPRTDWRELPDGERGRLEAACAPGLALLGY
jgi:putative sulfotransferase